MRTLALVLAFLLSACHPLASQALDLEENRVQVTLLAGLWRFHTGDSARWAEASFDDSDWPLLRTDTGWNNQGYPGYAGFGWYRMPVNVPPRPMRLALFVPAVGNSYEVFANGKLIGESRGMPPSVRVISDYRRLFSIPESVIEPGRRLVIAIRVWHWNRMGPGHGAGLLAAPIIGEATQIERLRVLATHDAFWNATDTGLNLVFNLLTAAAGLALFCLRRIEREYLWFGLAQLLWAAQALIILGASFLPLPYVLTGWLQVSLVVGAQLLNLEFFVTLMGQRKRRLYWTAASAVLITLILPSFVAMARLHSGGVSFAGTLLELVYAICVPALLYRGASRGNLDARLLILPFTLSFSLNVIGLLFALRGIAELAWASSVSAVLNRISDWPFPISAFNLAGNLAMFSVIAVLVFRYARSRRDEERFEAELEAARAVQHVLIPEKIPSVPGYLVDCVYKPAGQVGGDFFQIIPLQDGNALVAIGDVSGKGMPAAMTVSMVVGMVRILAQTTQSPAAILAAMNENMIDRAFGGFTTCLIMQISQDGLVTAANAGHIAPYLGGHEMPVANGLPLGLTTAATYQESAHQLSPNDQLTLLTDGVLEARKANGELFGFARTASISVRPVDEIAHAAEQFGQRDDITVLSLTRQPFRQKSKGPAESTTWSTATA
jgi:hypothetical protein